jgi:predicted nucleic acid-binding protein
VGEPVGCCQHSGPAGVGRQPASKGENPLDAKATREVVSDYLAWQVVVNGGESILETLDLEARYQISFWDALVIQAAQAAGAEILYSEDLSDGQRYGSVRVRNPLTGGE